MRRTRQAMAAAVLGITVLSGCMPVMGNGFAAQLAAQDSPAERRAGMQAGPASAMQVSATQEGASPIITALAARQSVLINGSAYADVAFGVLASDARVAQAELRVAQLRADAASQNWLPTLSPRVSLTALGDFAADLLVNQVLFDNGRKEAERDLAKANVELAALALSESSNARDHDGLMLYLQAEEGRAATHLYTQALEDMTQFEWVMTERVKGGVSDFSDLNVLRQKLADLRARTSAAQEQAIRAEAELAAMSAAPVSDLRGLYGIAAISTAQSSAMPPAVLRAVAERDRQFAQSRIARAQHLPGLALGGSLRGGADGIALASTSEAGLGLGTRASLNAIEAANTTAARRVLEVQHAFDRAVAADRHDIAALHRQAKVAAGLTTQAKTNLDFFQTQYEAGTRQVMDVAGVYETFLRALERELDLKFRAARAELDAAKRLGVLVDGARI